MKTTDLESALLSAHADLVSVTADFDLAVTEHRLSPTRETLQRLAAEGVRYAAAVQEVSGLFVDRAAGLPRGTTNARCAKLESKHTVSL